MNTPIVRNIVSIPVHQDSAPSIEALGGATDGATNGATNGATDGATNGATDGASVKARRIPSLAKREKFQARAPRGPFKILTIPQAWYDSLHADHDANDDTGKNE